MPTGVEPLRDDGIDTVRFEPTRLVDGRCRREYLGAQTPHPRQQFRRRQAEVEAHDRRPEWAQGLGGFETEGRAPGAGWNRVEVDAKFVVIRRQGGTPARFALGTGHGRRVAEEV